MRERKRYLIIILGIILISILGTFAWLTWKSIDTSLVLTIGDMEGTIVTLKPYMVDESLIPTLTYEGNEPINVDINNNGSNETEVVLYYEINNIDEELITDSFKYTILKSTDGETYEEYQTGNFSVVDDVDSFTIMEEKVPANTTYNYKVYTWLDGENETSSNIQGKSFKAELRANIYNEGDIIIDVPSGLIPVTILNDGTVTTISEDDSKWYDYSKQEWANGVLVTETSRNSYLNTTGVIIPESDILAYYVYIPRYKYKIWTTGTSSAGQEQEIEILFENKNMPKFKDSKVGEYITHPAFTFGDTELNGIWVGKFETTGIADQPTVKPNISSLANQDVSTQFQTSLKFAGGTLNNGVTTFSGSTTYGLNDLTNSHMAKNTEWSAAAYLSHSRYGINKEVRINYYWNNNTALTGCGATLSQTAESTTCENAYGSSSTYPQSTTGNISGIFDMSSANWEYVMGVFANSDGTLWSGNSTTYNSGFNGLLGSSGTSYPSGIDFPESKYYNVYKASNGTTISALTACDGGYCYGHGLSEISGWYGDKIDFVSSSNGWFGRGGNNGSGHATFLFGYGNDTGAEHSWLGFRSILTSNNSKEKTATLSVDLNGGTSSQNLAGIYPSSKQINLVTPTRSGYTFTGWKVTSGDGIVISNIFPDGSFENNIYSLSLSTTSNLIEGISVTNEISMYGSYSLMNYHAGQYISYYQEFDAIPNHKYYFSHYFYNKTFGINTSETVWNYSDMSFYYDSQEHWNGSGLGSNSIINEWHKVSIINTSPSVSSIIKTAACETNATNKGQHFYIDGAMLIDLTQTFGVGNEPTKEWMDKNINYFDNYMLYLFDQDTTIEAQWK